MFLGIAAEDAAVFLSKINFQYVNFHKENYR